MNKFYAEVQCFATDVLILEQGLIAPWSGATTKIFFQDNNLQLSTAYVKLKIKGENVGQKNL